MSKPTANKVAAGIREEFCLYKQNIEEMLAGFQTKIDTQEKSLPIISDVSISELLKLGLEDLKTTIHKEMDKMKSSIESRLNRIEDSLDEIEQYSRRNAILIHGVEERENEDVENVLLHVVKKKTQPCSFQNQDGKLQTPTSSPSAGTV